jgi:hypothetical protein
MILSIYSKDVEVLGKSKLTGLNIRYSPLLLSYVRYSLKNRETIADTFEVDRFEFGDIWNLEEFISNIRNRYGYSISFKHKSKKRRK